MGARAGSVVLLAAWGYGTIGSYFVVMTATSVEDVVAIRLSGAAMLIAAAIVAYATMGLWQSSARDAADWDELPAPTNVEIWGGWLVPILNLAVPMKVMRVLSEKAGWGRLEGLVTTWWWSYLGAIAASYATRLASHPTAWILLDSLAFTLGVVSCVALWIALGRMSQPWLRSEANA